MTIVGALILMIGLTRLAMLLQDDGSSCEVFLMVFFYFEIVLLIVDVHPRWSGRYLRRRILPELLNFMLGYPPSLEVQRLVMLLVFQGHAEGVLLYLCRSLVSLSHT